MCGPSSSSEQQGWRTLASGFTVAAAAQLDSRALTRRCDTKFVVPLTAMLEVAQTLTAAYAVIGPPASYDTLYFDTPELTLFHDHRRGRRQRHKVRIRHYRDRRLSFLEVKSRRSSALTEKTRLPRSYGDEVLSPDDQGLIRRLTGLTSDVGPRVWTSYERLTLVGQGTEERATFDVNLRFRGDAGEHELTGLAIVEVKQPRLDQRTPVMMALKAVGARPTSASKYCAALLALDPTLRCSRRQRALNGGNS